jgi:ABC-type transporter MlaC component
MGGANDTLKPYIVKAYQLWLMKGWDNIFRPKDSITKAEVNAVLVRMVLKSYLSENITNSWYDKYNKVWTDLGIIKQGAWIESVVRNDVALMLFRAYKNQKFSLKDTSFILDNRSEFIK